MKLLKKIGLMNAAMFTVLILTWIFVYAGAGLPRAYAWFSLKMVIPILGIAYLLLNVILWVINVIKKKSTKKRRIGFIAAILLSLHLLLLMNIIQLPYPSRIQNAQPSVTVNWPFAGKTVVGWGGDSLNTNLPHITWASERWAYDLVMEPYNTGSHNPDDYGIWNQEILSPASGIVIAAYDEEPDIEPGSESFLSMEGNHVYLKLDETGTYLLLNHLKQNSLTVKIGEHVQTGDLLGRVGNSGSTSEPHLHIHHQRQNPVLTPHPVLAEGLPLYFEGTDTVPMPQKGTVVSPSF